MGLTEDLGAKQQLGRGNAALLVFFGGVLVEPCFFVYLFGWFSRFFGLGGMCLEFVEVVFKKVRDLLLIAEGKGKN